MKNKLASVISQTKAQSDELEEYISRASAPTREILLLTDYPGQLEEYLLSRRLSYKQRTRVVQELRRLEEISDQLDVPLGVSVNEVEDAIEASY